MMTRDDSALSVLQIGRFKDHSSKKNRMFTKLKLNIYFAFRVFLMPVPMNSTVLDFDEVRSSR